MSRTSSPTIVVSQHVQDKKARKLTKKRLGTLLRSKRKLEELGTIIQESRRAH